MKALTGKVAVITGSTSGIGLAMAHAFAAEGATILLNGFGEPAAIQSIQEDIKKRFNVSADYSSADMSKPDQVVAMIKQAEEKFGQVDILVNNAGIQFTSPIEEFPDDKWNAIIAINLSAAFFAVKAALPGMKKRNFGRIINIASAHGLVASPHKVAYVTAKHGLIGFSKVVALENAESNITSNAICPGWVLTPLVQKQIDDRSKAEKISVRDAELALLSEKQPSKKFIQAEQLAAMAVFLCSDAGSTTTGSAFSMDGGWTAQ